MEFEELDRLADAITALSGARKRIPVHRLLRETALNVLILTRIASNRLDDHQRREDIEAAGDALVTQLRHAAWELPESPQQGTEAPPD
jgi:U3 small nucleolar ribonucleoprotein component